MAIKPRFADLIIAGKKVVEVRRGGSNIKPGDVLVLYSSSPQRNICATCRVASVETRTVHSALAGLNGETGLTKQELREYLHGAQAATLITIESVFRLSRPIPLKELRRHRSMTIPQSYRFLSETEISGLSSSLGA